MVDGRVNYGSWFFRVLGWDGIMPVCIVLIPTLIKLLIPNNRGAVAVTVVLLPIAAFFVRLAIGIRHIAANHCAIAVRRLQYFVFCLGIFLLIGVDTLLILSHEMPKGAMFANTTDYLAFASLFSIYLASMTIAMYPGRVHSLDDTAWPDDAFEHQDF